MQRFINPIVHDFYKRHIGELVKQFPIVFNKQFPLPLAVGTHKELIHCTIFTQKEINALLRVWVNRHEYICMAASLGRRYKLDGSVDEWIEAGQMTGFISNATSLHSGCLRRFCKRYLKVVGRPALIFIPINKRPELGDIGCPKKEEVIVTRNTE